MYHDLSGKHIFEPFEAAQELRISQPSLTRSATAPHGAPSVPVCVARPRQGSHPLAAAFFRAALRAPIPPYATAPGAALSAERPGPVGEREAA
ncbi:MAG TPA: hypothetical protein VGX23_01965 [Actinocrinis sp.]|nr:hypothetical protein [Actinocrinis sp.]